MYVLDYARPAIKKSRPKRLTIAAGTSIGVFVLCCLFLIIRTQMKKASTYYAVEKKSQEVGASI